LLNVCAQNRHASKLSGANCHAKLSHLIQFLKYSSSDVGTVLFIDEKDIYSGHTEKPKQSPTVRNCSYEGVRHRDKTPAYTINVQTVTDGISRRVTSGRQNTSLILLIVDYEVKVIEGCYRNLMLL